MYLHDFFNKYLNLVNKFMLSCNYKGVFQDIPSNAAYLFHSDYKHHTMFAKCHEHRN